MTHRVGIVGVSGYGGGEALRLLARHPQFELAYVAGESSAGTALAERFPTLPRDLGKLVIEKFDLAALPNDLDVLFASLPTGASRDALAQVRPETKIVDIGGDHRYADGWTYGLADVWPERVAHATRVANPGCYPAATLTALAPLLKAGLVRPGPIVVDAKSGVSGAGRGGASSSFGYSETNESTLAYGLLKHAHLPEMSATIRELGGDPTRLVFTPHLVPMTRGILATIYLTGDCPADECANAARQFYRGRAFVRVVDQPPATKLAAGTNFALVHYAADPQRQLVMAVCAIDNLGKGAAGQAVQNANLMCGLPEATGLSDAAVWP